MWQCILLEKNWGYPGVRNYTFTVVTKSGSDQNIPRRSTTISSSFTTKVRERERERELIMRTEKQRRQL